MYKNKTFLAIIPARGGSKRLPRKNVLNLCEKPLIAYTIEAGLKSNYIDNVIVSSDNDEIITISKKYGADVIKRPSELASDTAGTLDVMKHAIKNVEKYDYIVLLQATSPLRNEYDIDKAIELIDERKADAIISVCEMDHSPLISNTLPDDGNMNKFLKDDSKNKRSQDFETYYRPNGAIYIHKISRLIDESTLYFNSNIFSFKMSKESSVDIDTKFDFLFAEYLLNYNGDIYER